MLSVESFEVSPDAVPGMGQPVDLMYESLGVESSVLLECGSEDKERTGAFKDRNQWTLPFLSCGGSF